MRLIIWSYCFIILTFRTAFSGLAERLSNLQGTARSWVHFSCDHGLPMFHESWVVLEFWKTARLHYTMIRMVGKFNQSHHHVDSCAIKDTIHMQHPTMGLCWRGDRQNPFVEHEGHLSGIVETFIGEFCWSWSVDEVGTRKDDRSPKAWVAKDRCSDRSPKVPRQRVRAEKAREDEEGTGWKVGRAHLCNYRVPLNIFWNRLVELARIVIKHPDSSSS